LEERVTSIFRVEEQAKQESSMNAGGKQSPSGFLNSKMYY
jgi:hypothetical protein